MPAHQAEVVAAARTLVEWARGRQSAWGGTRRADDPSADLLSALGTRYQALSEPEPDAPAPPAPPPVLPQPQVSAPPPAVVPRAPVAPAPAVASTPAWVPAPAPVSTPRVQTMPSPAPPAPPRNRGGRWLSLTTVAAVAAVVVVAALAAPAVWRSYAPKTVAAPLVGTVSLESNPAGSTVLIDGVEIGRTPLTRELSAGAHAVEFRYKKATRKIDVNVVGGETATGSVDWTRRATGRLLVTSDAANTTVVVDGKARGAAPVTIDALNVGAHTVVLQSAQGSVKRTLTIRDGDTTEFAGSIYPGSLTIAAPFEIHVMEGSAQLPLDERGQAAMSPGPHVLKITNALTGTTETRTVDIVPGKVTSLTLSAEPSGKPPASAEPAPAPHEAAPAAAAPETTAASPDPAR